MKTYDFPQVQVGGVLVPRLIMGHLPFIGESYQGVSRNRLYIKAFSNVENTIQILSRAVGKYGVSISAGTPATDGKLAELHLQALRETMNRLGKEIALIPCLRIPLTIEGEPIDDYRRWLTYLELEKQSGCKEILKKYLDDPILQCREGWRQKFLHTLKNYSPYRNERVHINFRKVEAALGTFEDFRVLFFELGSETDFLALTGRLELLGELVDRLSTTFGYPAILATHHPGSTIPILERSSVRFQGYVTPINKLGVMMFPNQEKAEEAVRSARRPVIAIKPLAGGRIKPYQAFKYVYHDMGAASCMIGVASEKEVEQNLTAVSKVWYRRIIDS